MQSHFKTTTANMKTLLILFTVLALVISTAARCSYGCYCSSDDTCDYYCSLSMCQRQISLGSTCSGYYVHPRECGSIYYCDPYTYTCQFQKNYGEYCTYSYTCLSGYCSPSSNTCEIRFSFSWQLYILVPILAFVIFCVFIIVFIIVCTRQRRASVPYANRCVIVPAGTPYSYQNQSVVGEVPPPSYSASTYPQVGKTYPN